MTPEPTDGAVLLEPEAERRNAEVLEGIAGDGARFSSRDRTKDRSFSAFVRWAGPRLDDLGLGEQTLRQCVRAALVASSLPEAQVQALTFRHLVALYRVGDAGARALLGGLATAHGWSVRTLELAAQRVADGRWPDDDPKTPGFQLSEPGAAEVTGKRVASRIERTAGVMESLVRSWGEVGSIEEGDRARARQAVARMKEWVGRLEQELGGADPG
jgi:hypothetical protein